MRAQACVDALARLGVDRERLFVTYTGMGTHIRTDFIPRSMRPYSPMPEGDWHEYATIVEGVTTQSGDVVQLPLQTGAALYADVSGFLSAHVSHLQPTQTLSTIRMPPPALLPSAFSCAAACAGDVRSAS